MCVCVCEMSGGGGNVCIVSLCWEVLGATGVFVGLSLCCTSAKHLLCVLCAGGWRAATLRVWCVCQVSLCPVCAHAVAEMHAGPVVWGLVGALMGVCYLTRWRCCGGLPHTWLLGDLGVTVLVCSGDTLCVTRCTCLLGGCDLRGVRFINPKPSSQCL